MSDSQKRLCLALVRDSDRALASLVSEMERAQERRLAAYTIAKHVREMLLMAFKSIDEQPVRTGQAA